MKNKQYKNSQEFEWVCDDILNAFLCELKPPYTREVTEEDMEEFGIDDCTLSFLFTDKGRSLMDRFIARLQKLGEAKFPEDNIEIQCTGVVEL